MEIREIMTPQSELAGPEMNIRDAATKMRESDVGALPVGENDRLIGMVTDRDIVVRGIAADVDDEKNVRDVMSEHIYYCFEEDSLIKAGQVMAEHQVRRLPVLNGDKRLVGMIALADLARSGDEGVAAATNAIHGISEDTGEPRQ